MSAGPAETRLSAGPAEAVRRARCALYACCGCDVLCALCGVLAGTRAACALCARCALRAVCCVILYWKCVHCALCALYVCWCAVHVCVCWCFVGSPRNMLPGFAHLIARCLQNGEPADRLNAHFAERPVQAPREQCSAASVPAHTHLHPPTTHSTQWRRHWMGRAHSPVKDKDPRRGVQHHQEI